MANPNFDGVAEPDDTYVDIDYGNPYRLLNLPAPKKTGKSKKKERPIEDDGRMRDIELQLALLPSQDWHNMSSAIPDDIGPKDDGFVERPLPTKKFDMPKMNKRHGHFEVLPMDNELAAADAGQRWRYNLERSFMMPGSQWNDTVFKGVDAEKPYYTDFQGNPVGKTASDKNGMMSPLAYARIRAQWLNERNKMIQDYINGNWDDPERAYTDFKRELADFDVRMANAGFDTTGLREAPPLSGKRSGFTEKTGPSKLRRQWNYTNSIVNEIKDWIDTGKINDETFMNSHLTSKYLDDVYETLTKYFKESGNAMADEEKKRLQIQVLPEASYELVLETVRRYQKALAQVMSSSSAKDWSQNNRGKVNEIIKALGFDPDNMDKATLGEQMAVVAGVISAALAKNDELPHDVATDLNALNKQYDAYMNNMMLAANVGLEFVTQAASRLGNSIADAYNDQAFNTGRSLADNLASIEDLTDKIPKDMVKPSPLLQPPMFITPSLAKRPKGKASTNPESKGENAPVAPAEEVPGVVFED